MAWGNQLYILADNDLYCSSDGKSWSKMGTNTKFEKLIAGVHSEHNCKLYAIDTNNHFMESTDALVWDTNGEVPLRDTWNPFSESDISTNLALGFGTFSVKVSRMRRAACGSLATIYR